MHIQADRIPIHKDYNLWNSVRACMSKDHDRLYRRVPINLTEYLDCNIFVGRFSNGLHRGTGSDTNQDLKLGVLGRACQGLVGDVATSFVTINKSFESLKSLGSECIFPVEV